MSDQYPPAPHPIHEYIKPMAAQQSQVDITTITVEVQKLSLKPGDILALKVSKELTDERFFAIEKQLYATIPKGVKVIILLNQFEFHVIEFQQNQGD